MRCRHCHSDSLQSFINLETSPPSNSYLTADELSAPEKWYPLRVFACTQCWLVQTEDYAHFAELFSSDYAYFSSFSRTWLEHAERYVEEMVRRFSLGHASRVVEVASNDGYLLQYVRQRAIPCLGIEPTRSTAIASRAKGIEVVEEFLGMDLARRLLSQGYAADLMVANNVLAHVPDINDFVSSFAVLLKDGGVATFEFPHLMRLVIDCQFDTIYHEHFSYLSLTSVKRIFEANGLAIFDVEEIGTHGGSLRVFAQRRDVGSFAEKSSVNEMLDRESAAGVSSEAYYSGFQARADKIKDDLQLFLIEAKRSGKRCGAYGAAAKGNTLMNYAGVRSSLIPWVVDRNPAKVGKYLPGSRIPIVDEKVLQESRPDYVLILPWNIKDEVVAQLSYIRDWGGRFVTAIPEIVVQ